MLNSVARHSLLIAVAIVFLSPFIFVIFTSLMTRDQALTRAIWPHPFRFQNYADVLANEPLLRWTWNTFLIAFLSSVGVVISCAPPAYALSRMRFRGRNLVFLLVLSTMMLPIQVTIIPLYVLFSHLGWIGSLKPLIIPSFFGDAFSIFLLRQFFLTIPDALTDAARVDGASEMRLLLRVVDAARQARARGGLHLQLPLLLERPLRAAALPGRRTRTRTPSRSASRSSARRATSTTS